ncbi:HIT family protein [Candidatus Giovannonibacteria bacterium]|nr:HIT family protein [Candidatus Giovannonibacteria bacterium]
MIINCPFCSIDEDKTRIIEEKERIVVILSSPSLMPGHILVIPKRHIEKISELNPDERADLFDTAIEYHKKIIERFSKGCDMRQHYRPFLAQSDVKVDHVHIHLLPRENEDELYQKSMQFERDMWQRPDEIELQKFVELFGK